MYKEGREKSPKDLLFYELMFNTNKSIRQTVYWDSWVVSANCLSCLDPQESQVWKKPKYLIAWVNYTCKFSIAFFCSFSAAGIHWSEWTLAKQSVSILQFFYTYGWHGWAWVSLPRGTQNTSWVCSKLNEISSWFWDTKSFLDKAFVGP